MKVLVAAASWSAEISGVQRHALNLAHSLLTQASISRVELVVAPWQERLAQNFAPSGDARLRVHIADMRPQLLSRNAWLYSGLPLMALRLGVDVVHLAYPVPLRQRAFRVPVAVTLHDLYPYDVPANFGYPKVLFNRAVLRQCLHAADAIACVSRSTYARLRLRFPSLATRKATTIYNAVPAPSPARTVDAAQAVPFLLCVAQHRRNKNVLLAVQAFHRLLADGRLPSATQLVIVGTSGPETAALRAYIEAAGRNARVVLLSGISDARLTSLYRHCRLLLAPSTVEGFGLPVVEGLMQGTPIVCSDIAAFRELAGDRCIYFQLGQDEQSALCAAIERAWDTPRPAPEEMPQCSPRAIGAQYASLYRSLLLNQPVRADYAAEKAAARIEESCAP